MNNRAALVRRAFQLEWLAAAWMLLEVAVAIGSGIAAHSLSLIAFGGDSLIELASAGLLLWRLGLELRPGNDFPETVERAASRIGGTLLFALAGYVVASAAYRLWTRNGQEFSMPGLILAVVAVPVMYWLARTKRRIAAQIDSAALRADVAESIACAYLSMTVVIGQVVQAATGAWWVDSVTALAIVGFLVKEGIEAWQGE